jgi:ATP-dependent RNA helicase DeaD
VDPRLLALADTLLAGREARDLLALLLARAEHTGPCAPAEVTPILPPAPRVAQTSPPPPRARGAHGRGEPRFDRSDARPDARSDARPGARSDSHGGPREQGAGPGYVSFRVNWGERQGADPRRLLALVCRRGNIRGSEVGSIRIGFAQSTFDVAAPVAEGFARAAREPDARDPKIHITRLTEADGGGAGGGTAPARARETRPHRGNPRAPTPQPPGRPREPDERSRPEQAEHEGPSHARRGPPPRAPREPGAAKGYGPPKRKLHKPG